MQIVRKAPPNDELVANSYAILGEFPVQQIMAEAMSSQDSSVIILTLISTQMTKISYT